MRRGALALVAACLLASAPGCVHEMSGRRTAPGTSPSPAVPWQAPPAERGGEEPPIPPSPPAGIPDDLLASAGSWTLSDLVDLALRNSPATRIAWAQARSAAADLGSREGTYYPTIAGQLNASAVRGSAAGGRLTFRAQSFNPYVSLSWLLLDFGGRRAAVDGARQTLVAADWIHNAAIQDVVLQVEQAYYQYLNARALEEAETTAVTEAQASLDAAEARRRSGVGTIADALQAKTRLSQARLALETVQGLIQTIKGSLATAIGLQANAAFDVAAPPAGIPGDAAAVEIEAALDEARKLRPELAAARALVEKARADVRARQAADRPFLVASATPGRIFYAPVSGYQDTYTASLLLTIPIFNGLGYQYNLLRAQADRDAAEARLASAENDVALQVWTSYFNHRTADQRVATSKDLLDSAAQSFEVVTARYKAGVGSILDLLTAQTDLESARAQQALARTDWFLTLAQLAHDTGTLWRPGPAAPSLPAPVEGSK